MRTRLRRSLLAAALLCFAGWTSGCRQPRSTALTLSVAASLQDSMTEIEAAYQRDHRVEFRNNFGASGTLAREIEQGAPVDAFISAGARPMDQLKGEGLLLGIRVRICCAIRWY